MAKNFAGIKLCAWLLVALLGACAGPGLRTGVGTVSSPTSSSGISSGVSTPEVQPATATLVGSEWIAFAIHGAREVTGSKPRLRWVATDQITGTGGCNGFRGRSSANLASLQLGPLSSTGRACLSLPGSQEDLFFKALELTRKARLESDQLILMDDAGKQLARFLRSN